MAIYRKLTAYVKCDICGRTIAFMQFDSAVEEVLEDHTKVWCPACHEKNTEEARLRVEQQRPSV